MDDKIKLSEYLDIAVALEEGTITPEESEEKFSSFFSKLVIKDYLPHKNKAICLGKILFSLGEIFDEITTAAYLEMERVAHGLLAYCVNLENDIESLGRLYSVYDAIHQYGLYDYILQFCSKDFALFSQMLSDMINISHIKKLTESAALFDNAAFEKWVADMNGLREQLTPEVLKGLVQLSAKNNGATEALLETLSEAAVEASDIEMNKQLSLMEDHTDTQTNPEES